MDRRDQRQTSTYSRQVLESPELQRSIRLLTDIVSSCYGPFGKIKTVQNSCGGHVTLTSTSQRLFNVLSLSKPVLKLIVGATQCHLKSFKDGGLFSTTLTLHLIKEGLGLEIHRRLVVEAFDLFLGIVISYLKSDNCEVKFSLKDAGLHEILKLARTIIEPKWHGCPQANLEFIVQLTVEAFLKSLSVSNGRGPSPENVHFVLMPCPAVTESKLFCGVMLDLCGRAAPSPANLKCIRDLLRSGRPIPVVVISVSMAGDLGDFIQAGGYDINIEVDVDEVSKARIKNFAQALVNTGLKVVFCQKVIHPDVKTFLRNNGVFAVDRLGAAACRIVQHHTGAQLVTMISDDIDSTCLASLDSLSVEEVCGKSYLLLSKKSSPDVTVVLCHRQQEILEEIKVACEAAIHSLYINIHQPEVLAGGGCWQAHLAHYLQEQVSEDKEELVKKLRCSTFQLLSICSAFSQSLILTAISIGQPKGSHMIDSANHHLWTVQDRDQDQESAESLQTCCCGSFTRNETTTLSYLTAGSSNLMLRMNLQTSEVLENGSSKHIADYDTGVNLDTSKKSNHTSSVCMPEPSSTTLSGLKISENVGTDNFQKYFDKIQVLDSFPVQLNAFHTAVSTAMAVLSVSQYIQDTN